VQKQKHLHEGGVRAAAALSQKRVTHRMDHMSPMTSKQASSSPASSFVRRVKVKPQSKTQELKLKSLKPKNGLKTQNQDRKKPTSSFAVFFRCQRPNIPIDLILNSRRRHAAACERGGNRREECGGVNRLHLVLQLGSPVTQRVLSVQLV